MTWLVLPNVVPWEPSMNRRTFLATALAAPALTSATALRAREVMKVRDLYAKGGGFSPIVDTLHGKRIVLQGIMAPPLKAESTFFVLTNRPMSV